MKRILILFAHPRYEHSRANKHLLKSIPKSDYITFHDLYEAYPDFNIDIEYEKSLLEQHDIIIWHHPFYWYSAPPLLKQWIDMVLEFKWAYGPGGEALKDKWVMQTLTSGGTREVYQHEGRNRYTIQEFLRPFEQTVRLCKMKYLPPFAVQGTHRQSIDTLTTFGQDYAFIIQDLLHADTHQSYAEYEYMNDYIEQRRTRS